jgi:hypothetical protein
MSTAVHRECLTGIQHAGHTSSARRVTNSEVAATPLQPPLMHSIKDAPDHHDADLILKLYELRTDPVMRQSRTDINSKFAPASYEEFLAVTQPNHEHHAAYRQVSSYWEMVYAMAKHGVVHGEFMLESCGEGLLLYAKVRPFLERFRIAGNTKRGQLLTERFTKRLAAASAGR